MKKFQEMFRIQHPRPVLKFPKVIFPRITYDSLVYRCIFHLRPLHCKNITLVLTFVTPLSNALYIMKVSTYTTCSLPPLLGDTANWVKAICVYLSLHIKCLIWVWYRQWYCLHKKTMIKVNINDVQNYFKLKIKTKYDAGIVIMFCCHC